MEKVGACPREYGNRIPGNIPRRLRSADGCRARRVRLRHGCGRSEGQRESRRCVIPHPSAATVVSLEPSSQQPVARVADSRRPFFFVLARDVRQRANGRNRPNLRPIKGPNLEFSTIPLAGGSGSLRRSRPKPRCREVAGTKQYSNGIGTEGRDARPSFGFFVGRNTQNKARLLRESCRGRHLEGCRPN